MANLIENSWNTLFEKYDILHRIEVDGFYIITATQINTVKEARLMARFNSVAQMPAVFRNNKLSILPTKRGEYVLAPMVTHMDVDYPFEKPTYISPPNIRSLNGADLYSEAVSIVYAHHAGIFERVMNTKLLQTISGRMSSGAFDFMVDSSLNDEKYNISVMNSQVEIDAAFDSKDGFVIVEGKNLSTPEVLVRQLYYPYRLWSGKLDVPVTPIFFAYSNDIFHVFVYRFRNLMEYNSMELVSYDAFTTTQETVTMRDVVELWKGLKTLPESQVTFPQADSFERIVDLLTLLEDHPMTPDDVTDQYVFESRQTSYYIAAGRYLGLIETGRDENGQYAYLLTSEGKIIMGSGYHKKYMGLIKKVLQMPVFHACFGAGVCVPDRNRIKEIMKNFNLPINDTTINRRASTVRGWIEWIYRITQ